MRSKSPLVLMEQMVMLLVFALAAALCLRLFVLTDRTSRRIEARDAAVIQVQNVAEIARLSEDAAACAKRLGGKHENGCITVDYDADWNAVPQPDAYVITISPQQTEDAYLGKLRVTARTAEGEELFAVTVCRQEAAYG